MFFIKKRNIGIIYNILHDFGEQLIFIIFFFLEKKHELIIVISDNRMLSFPFYINYSIKGLLNVNTKQKNTT